MKGWGYGTPNEISLDYNKTPFTRVQVNRFSSHPVRLGLLGRFVDNSKIRTCLEITGYRIKYSTVLWCLELQIRLGRKVWTQVHTINSNNGTSNCQFILFSKQNSITRIFCISGCLDVPINPDKWSSTVFGMMKWETCERKWGKPLITSEEKHVSGRPGQFSSRRKKKKRNFRLTVLDKCNWPTERTLLLRNSKKKLGNI